MSETVQLAVVGVVVLLIKEYFDWRRADKIAAKVETVAGDLKTTNKTVTNQLMQLDSKVEIVHKATNSMKDELVEEVRKASFAAGAKDERDRSK